MSLEQQKAVIEAAEKKLGESRKALLRPDGARLYSDAEHAEREARIDREFRQTLAQASAAVGEVLQEAEAVLSEGPDDPLYSLSQQELELANLRRPFVDDDCDRLSLRELADKVNAALRQGDKATIYLYHRGLQRRFDALPKAWHGMTAVPTNPADSKAFTTLSNLLERLGERLVDPAKQAQREREQEAAREKQSEATAVIGAVALSRFMEQNYGRRGR